MNSGHSHQSMSLKNLLLLHIIICYLFHPCHFMMCFPFEFILFWQLYFDCKMVLVYILPFFVPTWLALPSYYPLEKYSDYSRFVAYRISCDHVRWCLWFANNTLLQCWNMVTGQFTFLYPQFTWPLWYACRVQRDWVICRENDLMGAATIDFSPESADLIVVLC